MIVVKVLVIDTSSGMIRVDDAAPWCVSVEELGFDRDQEVTPEIRVDRPTLYASFDEGGAFWDLPIYRPEKMNEEGYRARAIGIEVPDSELGKSRAGSEEARENIRAGIRRHRARAYATGQVMVAITWGRVIVYRVTPRGR